MIKWIQDIARSLKLHPGLEIFFANYEENISVRNVEKQIRNCLTSHSPQATMQQYRTALIYPPELQNETGKPFRDPMEPSTWAFKG